MRFINITSPRFYYMQHLCQAINYLSKTHSKHTCDFHLLALLEKLHFTNRFKKKCSFYQDGWMLFNDTSAQFRPFSVLLAFIRVKHNYSTVSLASNLHFTAIFRYDSDLVMRRQRKHHFWSITLVFFFKTHPSLSCNFYFITVSSLVSENVPK